MSGDDLVQLVGVGGAVTLLNDRTPCCSGRLAGQVLATGHGAESTSFCLGRHLLPVLFIVTGVHVCLIGTALNDDHLRGTYPSNLHAASRR